MIQWHEFGSFLQSHCGRFEIEEIGPGGWQAVRTDGGSKATSPVFGSVEEAKSWCGMFVRTPADDVRPDVLIETVDGQTVILPASEAPEF